MLSQNLATCLEILYSASSMAEKPFIFSAKSEVLFAYCVILTFNIYEKKEKIAANNIVWKNIYIELFA